jgi:hypothetical protein
VVGVLTHEQKQLAFRLRGRGSKMVDITREIGCTAQMVGLVVRGGWFTVGCARRRVPGVAGLDGGSSRPPIDSAMSFARRHSRFDRSNSLAPRPLVGPDPGRSPAPGYTSRPPHVARGSWTCERRILTRRASSRNRAMVHQPCSSTGLEEPATCSVR